MIAPDPNEEKDPELFIRGSNSGRRGGSIEVKDTQENRLLQRRYSSKRHKNKNSDVISDTLKKKHGYTGERSETFVEPNQKLTSILDKQEIIKENKENEKSHDFVNDFRVELKRFVMTTFLGRRYMNILLALSIFSCLQYIYQTYLNPDNGTDKTILDFFGFLELILAGLFGFDWALWLFLADHRLEQLLSFFALVDFLTVIPIWLTYFVYTTPVKMSELATFSDAINYMMYGAYTLRILRVLRVHKFIAFMEDEVQRFLAHMTLSVLTLILFVSALMKYLEQETQDEPFHTWIYFLVVTMSTVGYGDIKPFSVLGRFGAMFFICFAIIFVPQQSNELIEKMNRVSFYSRRHFKPQGNSQHILICGDLESTDLVEFFSELFHEDHEMTNLHAVILQPSPPSDELHRILRDPIFSLLIHFLEGSVLNDTDLRRAKADQAIAIFFMGNKFSATPDVEDAHTILQQFSVKRFLGMNISVDPLFCMQLIRPENRRHLGADGDDERDKDLVVCLNELKMGIIAKSVMFPGSSTMIFNLLTSFAEDAMAQETENTAIKKKKKKKRNDHNFKLMMSNIRGRVRSASGGSTGSVGSDDSSFGRLEAYDADWTSDEDDGDDDNLSDGHWLEEYQKGCDWEIYTSPLSDLFEGALFINVASALYSKLGVILFALKIHELHGKNRTRVILNPANFKIPHKENYFVEGFVIAKNKEQSDLSFKEAMGGDDHEVTLLKAGIRKAMNTSSSYVNDNDLSGFGLHGIGDNSTKPLRKHRLTNSAKAKLAARKFTRQREKSDWQLLMSDWHINPSDKKNNEEVRQKEIETRLVREYYVRPEGPRDYAECIIKTSVHDEYPYMLNHLIVVAKSLNSLYDFICPLRAKYLRKLTHIVILYPKEIPLHIWRRIGIFEGILHVRGSPLEEADLRRAGVFRAAQVIVLADPQAAKELGNVSTKDHILDDADAIFTYHSVKRLNEKAQVMVEIVRYQNVAYLDHSSYGEADYKFTPQFASGLLFTSSMLDSIVCQAFYNPQIIRVLNQLISGTDHLNNFAEDQKLELKNKTKSLRSPTTGVRGTMKSPTSKRSTTKDKVKEKKRKKNQNGVDIENDKINIFSIRGSALYQIPVPDKLETKTYGACAEYLACRGVLPLGIFRGVFPNMMMGARGNKMAYVFTNPSKDVELFSCDRIFVLSQNVLSNSNRTIEEVLAHFYATSKIPKPIDESLANMPRVMSLVETVVHDKQMQKILKEKISEQQFLEEQFKLVDRQMTKDFDFCMNTLKSIYDEPGSKKKDDSKEDLSIMNSQGGRAFQRMNSNNLG